VIWIPEILWERLLDEFDRVDNAVERVAYLDGFRLGDGGVVTTVTIPDADLYPGYYNVTARAMSQAGQHLRTYGMTRLAQVHTHGGSACAHSPRDDAAAYSQRLGSVSIVLPFHARSHPAPSDGGVHARQAPGWVLLDAAQVPVACRLLPSLLDFRRPKWTESRTGTLARLTAALSRWTRRSVLGWRSASQKT
jgi:hypothetical protein